MAKIVGHTRKVDMIRVYDYLANLHSRHISDLITDWMPTNWNVKHSVNLHPPTVSIWIEPTGPRKEMEGHIIDLVKQLRMFLNPLGFDILELLGLEDPNRIIYIRAKSYTKLAVALAQREPEQNKTEPAET